MSAIVTSVVDPDWFQCGSRSGSRKPNLCGSRRIRILIRLFSYKKLHFYMENILKVAKMSKNVPKKVQKIFYRQKIRFLCKLWPISMLLDPDPHSQYGSGSKTAKRIRIYVDPEPDPQH
jgi:hypothetical protein